MDKNDKFLKDNLNGFHIAGILTGAGLSTAYWAKAGRFSDNVLKSSPVLMTLWGILVGYILFDFVYRAIRRKDRDE